MKQSKKTSERKSIFSLLAMLLIGIVMIGCENKITDSGNDNQQSQSSSVSSSVDIPSEILPEDPYASPGEANFRSDFIPSTQTSATEEEKQEILNAVQKVEDAQLFFRKFFDGMVNHDIILDQAQNPYPKIEGYALMENYADFEDLEAEILQLFSLNCAKTIFYPEMQPYCVTLDNTDIAPFIIEVNGQLYCDYGRYGVSGGYVYLPKDAEIITAVSDKAIVSIPASHYIDTEMRVNLIAYLVKENGNWVFDQRIS